MTNFGSYPVYFKGSRLMVMRCVMTDGKKFFVRWYGNLIEVEKSIGEYFQTVETY